jgi:Domain of unknown function (DUF4123)
MADTGERARATRLDNLSDQLHRGFASSDSSYGCQLLLDTSPLGMQEPDEPALAALLNHSALSRVDPSHDAVPVGLSPVLLPVDPSASAGSGLLRSSLELALRELQSPRLAHGAGRVIAAWLESEGGEAAQTALRRHLARAMFTRRADGRIEWLRWYDPAVMWLLWPHLSAQQQHMLLGPIRRYWLLTPSAALQCLSAPAPSAQSEQLPMLPPPIEFTAAQWAVVDGIGAMNLALRQLGASALDDAALALAAAAGTSALARAQAAGFTDREDLAEYACRAITCHPEFDRHAIVADRLRLAPPGEFFTAIVDDITDRQWQEIAKDLIIEDRHSPR